MEGHDGRCRGHVNDATRHKQWPPPLICLSSARIETFFVHLSAKESGPASGGIEGGIQFLCTLLLLEAHVDSFSCGDIRPSFCLQ